MGIFNWVQCKISKRKESMRRHATEGPSCYPSGMDAPEEPKERSNGVLAIGALGKDLNGIIGNSLKDDTSEGSCASGGFEDITVEELNTLQNARTILLLRKKKSGSHESTKSMQGTGDLLLERYMSCPSSLEIDRGTRQVFHDDADIAESVDALMRTQIILRRGRDDLKGDCSTSKWRFFSLLLKKVYNYQVTFAPTLEKDTSPGFRIEKILKSIFHKKICTQNAKYLEKESMDEEHIDDRKLQNREGCKWIKRDSEYIVLEM